MGFFATILRSIYSPRFYASIPGRSTAGAIGYFLLLVLVLTIGDYVRSLPSLRPMFDGTLGRAVATLAESYPDDLSISIQHGRVSTNLRTPYVIPNTDAAGPGEPANLLVIDTQTPFSQARFRADDTYAWLTADSLFVEDGQSGEARAIDLSSIGDFTLDKGWLVAMAATVVPIVDTAATVIGLLIFVFIYLWHCGRLLYLLLLALLIMVAASLRGARLTYGQAYRVGLYAVTGAFLVEFLTALAGMAGFPFMFTVVTLLIVLLNVGGEPARPDARVEAPPALDSTPTGEPAGP